VGFYRRTEWIPFLLIQVPKYVPRIAGAKGTSIAISEISCRVITILIKIKTTIEAGISIEFEVEL